MKKVLTTLLFTTLSMAPHARMTAFDATTAFEKEALGFEITDLKTVSNDGYVSGMDLTAVIGRDTGDFKLHLNGILLLPVKGDQRRKNPRVKLGAIGMALNPELSLEVFNQLAVDYTPKKIGEGVKTGNSEIKCSAPTKCSLMDTVGYYDLFSGNQASGIGEVFRTYIYGSSQYQSFHYQGKVLNGKKLTKSFTEALKNQMLNMAPDTIKYFQISSSTPNNSRSLQEHTAEANEDVLKDLGESKLEQRIVRSLLKNFNMKLESKIKKPSRSGCTYFCGQSGRFVQATTTANLNF